MPKETCEICGKELESNQKKYCSPECRGKSLRNGPENLYSESFLREEYWNKGKTQSQIAEELGTRRAKVGRWMKKLGVERRSFDELNKGMRNPRARSIPKTGLTREKAYVLGVIGPGDGWLSRKEINLETVDEEFAVEFSSCLKKAFGLEPIVVTYPPNPRGVQNRIRATLCSLAASRDLRRYGKLKDFRHHTEKVPEKIKESSENLKSRYLRGFYDSQGYPGVDDKYISAQKANKSVLKEIKGLLSDLRIGSRIVKGSIQNPGYRMWNLTFSSEESIRNYAERIGFSIDEKKKKLESILREFEMVKIWVCPICSVQVKDPGRYVHFRNNHPNKDYYKYKKDFTKVIRTRGAKTQNSKQFITEVRG